MILKDWLRISIAFGAGNFVKWQYIDRLAPEQSLYRLLHDAAFDNDKYVKRLRRITDEQVESILRICDKNSIDVITISDKDFPDGLRYIPDPPALLFVKGKITAVNKRASCAVIGTRKACEYSLYAAKRFAFELARDYDVNIVSGFAAGSDAAAHSGAIEANGCTTAVLGCGILHDYPKGSYLLKKKIAENGAVISEYLPTAQPAKGNFKIRNRLLTGLSDCLLIVEASSESGALNTAGHAAEQGKELFVIPPRDIFSERFAGQAGLISDGAKLALAPRDVAAYLSERHKWKQQADDSGEQADNTSDTKQN